MTKCCSRLVAFAAAILAAGTHFPNPASAQNINDFINMFGGMVQQAMRQAAQSEWRRLPPNESACLDQSLRQQGASVDDLISRGVLPSDLRIAQLRSNCRGQVDQGPQSAPAQSSLYVVDGLALGGKVVFESGAYKQYQCSPSEKFPGFTWCHKEKTEKTNRGEVTSSNSILHSQDGTASYVNRYIEPAFFGPNEVQTEIDRLSGRFGERPRIFRMPQTQGLPNAVIAIWGAIQLEPVNASDTSIVASGGSIKGLLVSFLGDLQKSAKAGVPVYRLGGGAGFLWAATFNQDGRGVLRFLTVDASQSSPSAPIADQSATGKTVEAQDGKNTTDEEVRRETAEIEAAKRRADEDAQRQRAEAEAAKRAVEDSSEKLANAEAARRTADEEAQRRAAEAESYKKQIEDWRRQENYLLISAAALIIIVVSVATALIVSSRRKPNPFISPVTASPPTSANVEGHDTIEALIKAAVNKAAPGAISAATPTEVAGITGDFENTIGGDTAGVRAERGSNRRATSIRRVALVIVVLGMAFGGLYFIVRGGNENSSVATARNFPPIATKRDIKGLWVGMTSEAAERKMATLGLPNCHEEEGAIATAYNKKSKSFMCGDEQTMILVVLSFLLEPEAVEGVVYVYGPKPDMGVDQLNQNNQITPCQEMRCFLGPGVLAEVATVERQFGVGQAEACSDANRLSAFCFSWNLGDEQLLQLDLKEGCCYRLMLRPTATIMRNENEAFKKSMPNKF